MKRATIHVKIDGKPVDFQIHDDGRVVMASKKLQEQVEVEQVAAEMGFEDAKESELLNLLWALEDNPFDFMRHHKVFPKLLQHSRAVLKASTAHITEADNELMRESQDDINYFAELQGYGLYFAPTETGWLFELDYERLPSEIVQDAMAQSGAAQPLSRSMLAILDGAYSEGILWVEFDRDALEIEGFDVHEW